MASVAKGNISEIVPVPSCHSPPAIGATMQGLANAIVKV